MEGRAELCHTHIIYERKRHSPENRAFSAPLVRCSIAPVLLSLCRVAQLCRVARLCRFVFSAPLVRCSIAAVLLVCAVLLSLCNICAQETLSNELWPNLGNICAQETLSNELWPSLGNKLIKSNFWEKKIGDPGHGIRVHVRKQIKFSDIKKTLILSRCRIFF